MEENAKKNIHGKQNVEYEKIEIAVTTAKGAGQVVEINHTTEVDHECIIGIAQVFSNSDALPNATLELDIDSQLVFPKGFESKLIYAGSDVPPDDRFVRTINRKVKQTRITGKFTDGSALAVHEAYTANLYLMVLSSKD